MSFDWHEAELPAQPLPGVLPGTLRNLSERQGTMEFRRRSSLYLSNRARLLQFQAAPRLTPQQEREALDRFRATQGVVRCPPAFAAPSQAALR